MIANAVTVLIGLWLVYGAIFSQPAGEMENVQLAVAAALIAGCALLARRTDLMGWHSSTNLALAIVLGVLAALRFYVGQTPFAPFWIILLAGIAVAISALWSILYRPESALTSGE